MKGFIGPSVEVDDVAGGNRRAAHCVADDVTRMTGPVI